MIRDPSDGSSKFSTAPDANDINRLSAKTLVVSTTSGLREPSKRGDVQARLEASREWLKAYFQRKTGASA